MSSSGTAAGLGLLSAASWGGSDFVGGWGARRAPVLLIVASGQFFSLLVLLAICFGARLAVPGTHYLVFAALGGVEGTLALAMFYHALSMGAMGLTAALTGLLTALVPVVYSLFHDGLPAPLTTLGIAAGCVAIWLITHQSASKGSSGKDVPTPPAAFIFGALAGVGFGTQLILFRMASGGGILWAMTTTRIAGVVALLIVLAAMPPKGNWRGFWLTGILAGSFDTAGSLFYIRASQLGRLDVAAVVCSLYPAGTILLAALVLRERPSRRQMAGMALALTAVMLFSL